MQIFYEFLVFIILTSCSFHLKSLSSDASATQVFYQGIWTHKALPTTGPLHLLFYLPGKLFLFFGNAHASLVAHTVKNLPAMQETQVLSLGWEDILKKGMATHFSILAWRIPWTEEPGRLQSMGSQRVRHDWATNTFTLPHYAWLLFLSSSLCRNVSLFERPPADPTT